MGPIDYQHERNILLFDTTKPGSPVPRLLLLLTGDRSERGQTGSDAVKTSHAKADRRTREHQTDPIYLLIF